MIISQLIVQNSTKRILQHVKTTNETHHSRARESPLGDCLGMLMYATTRKKDFIEKLQNQTDAEERLVVKFLFA